MTLAIRVIPNSTHWVQTSNEAQACPVLPGDTRITMIYVDSLDPAHLVPKKELIPQLLKEAPDFLAALLALDLPRSGDRLNIPVIETSEKKNAQDANRTHLEMFIDEECHYVPGNVMKFSDFNLEFMKWLDPDQHRVWHRVKVAREIPTKFPKGRSTKDNSVILGNISFSPGPQTGTRLVLIDNHLKPCLEKPDESPKIFEERSRSFGESPYLTPESETQN